MKRKVNILIITLVLVLFCITGCNSKKEDPGVFEEYTGAYEITSLFGTITEKDGEVYLHLHLAASGADGNAIGGHLNKAVISGTLEMVVEPMEGHAGRTVNPLTGLNDIAF